MSKANVDIIYTDTKALFETLGDVERLTRHYVEMCDDYEFSYKVAEFDAFAHKTIREARQDETVFFNQKYPM